MKSKNVNFLSNSSFGGVWYILVIVVKHQNLILLLQYHKISYKCEVRRWFYDYLTSDLEVKVLKTNRLTSKGLLINECKVTNGVAVYLSA